MNENEVYIELERAWAQLAGIREIEKNGFDLSLEDLFNLCLDRALLLLRIEKGFWMHKEEGAWEKTAIKGMEIEEAGSLSKDILGERRTVRKGSLMSIPLIWKEEVSDRATFIKDGGFTYLDEKMVLPLLQTALFVIQGVHLEKERDKRKTIQELSASVGHRIGTQMATLASRNLILSQKITSVQQRFDEDIERFQKDTDSIAHTVQETREILNDFVGLLKPISLQVQRLELDSLIEEAMRDADLSSVVVMTHLEKVVLDGDKDRLKEVFVELLNNAKGFLPEKDPEIEISIEPKNDCVEIVFADNGNGIPVLDKRKIFESFFTTRRGGTGLGLCIIRRFIEAHRGKIWEEGTEGNGASFIISLPYKQEEICQEF
ncbi:MAG: HAMP domain-containing sensor histidine kinase [bacterium]